MVWHGRPVIGLMRSHRCGPAWPCKAEVVMPCDGEEEDEASAVAEVVMVVVLPLLCCRCPSRLCFWSLAGVSKRSRQPWYVHVYVPVSAEVWAGRRTSPDDSGALSLMLVSIEVRCAGNSGFASVACACWCWKLALRRGCGTKGYCCGMRSVGIAAADGGGMKLKIGAIGTASSVVVAVEIDGVVA